MRRFELRRRLSLPWAIGALVVLSAIAVASIVWTMLTGQQVDHVRQLAIAAVGGVAALLYFLYKQHHDETALFIDLFRDFNARFDQLNDPLNRIVDNLYADPTQPLTQDERQTLFDYFNLCAEENLFASAGYIDPAVWRAWRRGMRQFATIAAIRTLWLEELATGSYYGFTLEVVETD